MFLQQLPSLRRKPGLAIDGFPKWFRAAGAARARKPAPVQRFREQFQRVRGNRGFLLFSGGVADTDIEAGQQ